MLSAIRYKLFSRPASQPTPQGMLLSELPNENLDQIFKYLKLSTLLSLLRVSHHFYEIVADFTVFQSILKQYYPDFDQDELAITYNPYQLFRVLHKREFETMTLEARTLYDLALNADYEQLAKFNFEPDILFQRDAYNNLLILRITKLKDIKINDILFNNILHWFEKRAKLVANSGAIFFNYYRPEMQFSYETPKNLRLLDFAFCFDKMKFMLENHSQLMSFNNKAFNSRLEMLCHLGHLDFAKWIIRYGKNPFDFPNKCNLLIEAVKGDQTDMVDYLLSKHRLRFTEQKINGAMLQALQNNNIDIIKLLALEVDQLAELIITSYPGKWEEVILNSLHSFAKHGWDNMVEYILTYLVMFEFIPDVRSFLNSHPEILIAAAKHNQITTINLLLGMGANPMVLAGINTITVDTEKFEASLTPQILPKHR